jgi:hypothetical protein
MKNSGSQESQAKSAARALDVLEALAHESGVELHRFVAIAGHPEE